MSSRAFFESFASSDLLFRQLLLGRYRSWGGFTFDHFIILISVVGGIVYIYSMVLKIITDRYNAQLAAIPKQRLPFQEDMPRGVFQATLDESMRVQDAALNRRLDPDDNSKLIAELLGEEFMDQFKCGDESWYILKDHVTLHFPTVVRRSPAILERHALMRRPGLVLRDYKTVRAYVAALEKAFPSLNHGLCMRYVETYESVVYGEAPMRLPQYHAFIEIVMEVVSRINSKALLHVKSSGARSSAQREAQRTRTSADGLA